MQLIETIEVGTGGAASITFSSIPDSYTDLYLVTSFRSTRASNIADTVTLLPNGSSSNGTRTLLYTSSGSVLSTTSTILRPGSAPAQSATSNTFSNDSTYISNYASSGAKAISSDSVTENNATDTVMTLMAQNWNSSAAITSLTVQPDNGNFVEYSSASLYGITAD